MSTADSLRLLLAVLPTAILGVGTRESHRRMAGFEAQWQRRFGVGDAIALPSARAGLYTILKALGVGENDEVIMTGYTCMAAVRPVLYAGATPVFGDIDQRTFSITPDEADRLMGSRTKALMIQHTLGLPAKTDALIQIARSRGVPVIEDSALALGSAQQGRQLGDRGDAAVFSFELSKTISAGWGGLLQINGDRDLAIRARDFLRTQGSVRRSRACRQLYQAGISGFLYRPTMASPFAYPLAALFRLGLFGYSDEGEYRGDTPDRFASIHGDGHWSVLSRQLGNLDSLVAHQRRVSEIYQAVLTRHGIGRVVPPGEDEITLIRFPILVEDPARFAAEFSRQGITVGHWFDNPISPPPRDLSIYNYSPGQCAVAEYVGRHMVNLPVHTRMSPGDIETTAGILDSYLQAHSSERDFIARWLAEAQN